MITLSRKTAHHHGMENLVLLRWQYYQSDIQLQYNPSKFKRFFWFFKTEFPYIAQDGLEVII
jgi:hypothetical protein